MSRLEASGIKSFFKYGCTHRIGGKPFGASATAPNSPTSPPLIDDGGSSNQFYVSSRRITTHDSHSYAQPFWHINNVARSARVKPAALVDFLNRCRLRYTLGHTLHRTAHHVVLPSSSLVSPQCSLAPHDGCSMLTRADVTISRSLYRRSLKLALDWAVHRHLWRGQALYIRSLFEANRSINDPRQKKALLKETEKLLETWKHPDPYIMPTAPGGTPVVMQSTIDLEVGTNRAPQQQARNTRETCQHRIWIVSTQHIIARTCSGSLRDDSTTSTQVLDAMVTQGTHGSCT